MPEMLNPWFSMWTRPRETIRQIVAADPERMVLVIAGVVGMSNVLERAEAQSAGDRMSIWAILVVALVIGPITGILSLYVGGLLLRWTGGWLGGTADARNIRAAMAWSNVPVVWAMLLWIPQFMAFGHATFTSYRPWIDSGGWQKQMMIGIIVAEVVAAVWTLVLFIRCLSEVQGYSVWRAIGNTLLSVLVIAVPILVIAFFFGAM